MECYGLDVNIAPPTYVFEPSPQVFVVILLS